MREVGLGEFVELQRGQSYKSALVDLDGPTLLGLGTIERNGGFKANRLRTYGGDSPQRILVRPGDLYVSLKDMTQAADLLGAVARVPENVKLGRLTQDTVRLRVSEEIDSSYLYWVLMSPQFRAYCRRRGTGTTNLDLSREDFLGYRWVLPGRSMQRAIAEVLGALDDKIAANAQLVTRVAKLMTAIGASSARTATVADLAFQAKTQRKPAEFDEVVAHFSLPAFDESELPELVDGRSIRSNKFLVDRQAVLVTKLNPRIPRLWNIPIIPDSMALASTEFVVLYPKEVDGSELWSVMTQPGFWSELQGRVAGTSGSHQRVKPADILATQVPDPRELTSTNREALRALGLLSHAARVESIKLAETRDALLPALMSGKIRVKDAERVVEEVV